MSFDNKDGFLGARGLGDQARRLRDISLIVTAKQRDETLQQLDKLNADLYEHLMFQSLVPAFDDIPMRRVFPFHVYLRPKFDSFTKDLVPFEGQVKTVIRASGCDLVQVYPLLQGSKLVRTSLQVPTRMTRREFEDLEDQLAERIASTIRDACPGVTIINVVREGGSKAQGDWSEKMKNVSEALKNLLLLGIATTVLFGGVVISSQPSADERPPEIKISKVHRDDQLIAIPKILDADSAEQFPAIVKGKSSPKKERSRALKVRHSTSSSAGLCESRASDLPVGIETQGDGYSDERPVEPSPSSGQQEKQPSERRPMRRIKVQE